MAFSQLARQQMANPLGMLNELQALEALLDEQITATPAAGAILDAEGAAVMSGAAVGSGLGAILDNAAETGEQPNGAHGPDLEAEAADDASDGISEPTENERAERQQQLDEASRELNEASRTGVFDEAGQELYSYHTWRPFIAAIAAAARPPPPPVPQAEYFDIASEHSTPPPELVDTSPDTTPKRRRTAAAAAALLPPAATQVDDI